MKHKILWWFIGGILFLSTAFFTFTALNTNIIYSEANYIADFDDTRKVLWSVDNVFVAKVLKNKGPYTYPEQGPEETLFEVEVLYNIKWKLKGKQEIVQMWWYDVLWNLHLPYGTDYMQEGDIFLLTAWWEPYSSILSHENGSHLLATKAQIEQRLAESPSNSLKKVEKEIIRESDIVEEFRQAYKNEVYYEENEDWKYKISNTEKNMYKNLSESEKKVLEDPESGFVE